MGQGNEVKCRKCGHDRELNHRAHFMVGRYCNVLGCKCSGFEPEIAPSVCPKCGNPEGFDTFWRDGDDPHYACGKCGLREGENPKSKWPLTPETCPMCISHSVHVKEMHPSVSSEREKWIKLEGWVKDYRKSEILGNKLVDIEGGDVVIATILDKMTEIREALHG